MTLLKKRLIRAFDTERQTTAYHWSYPPIGVMSKGILFGATYGVPCHCGMLNVENSAYQGIVEKRMPKRLGSNGKYRLQGLPIFLRIVLALLGSLSDR